MIHTGLAVKALYLIKKGSQCRTFMSNYGLTAVVAVVLNSMERALCE